MLKNKKIRRFYFIFIICFSLALATFFVLRALEEKIVYFYTPTNLEESKDNLMQYIRIGGLVQNDSVTFSSNGLEVNFSITDNKSLIDVVYKGILPDLFRENQGVVVEGKFDSKKNIFFAKKVLAKHDENYMPPQVKKSLKVEK